MTRLLILRHGETEWTVVGRYTGLTDLALTSVGRAEARAQRPMIEHLLAGETPLVMVSPRRRTTQTANLALRYRQRIIEPLLGEYDYGDYEGLTSDEIEARAPGWDIWHDGCPGGETTDEVAAPADSFLEKIRSVHGSRRCSDARSHEQDRRRLCGRLARALQRCPRVGDWLAVDGRGASRPSELSLWNVAPGVTTT